MQPYIAVISALRPGEGEGSHLFHTKAVIYSSCTDKADVKLQ